MDTPTAAGRLSAAKALLRSLALLTLACAATAPAAPCADTDCDSPTRDSADALLGGFALRGVDLGDAGKAEDGVEAAGSESLAPLLFLAPRVTSILEDVFEADASAESADAGATTNDAGKQDVPEAPRRSPLADVDGTADAQGPAPDIDHASILPKYQRQMYRTDI